MQRRDPPAAFVDELGEAFRRLRPQGSHVWNFADCCRRLEEVVRRRLELAPPRPPGPDPGASERASSARARLRRAVGTQLEDRIRRVLEEATAPALEDLQQALEASLGGLVHLSARVDALEADAARRREPVDAPAWLVPPPDLAPWCDRVVGWMAGVSGEVVVGECGDGALPRALAAAGHRVRAAEPRGTAAWASAAGGVDVHLGPVGELVASREPGTIAGAVLAGVVDRLAVEDLVQLVELVSDRMAAGSPLVVIGASPVDWSPVALDLLPGRPLHPATWAFLLGRAGFGDIETATPSAAAYAVRAVR